MIMAETSQQGAHASNFERYQTSTFLIGLPDQPGCVRGNRRDKTRNAFQHNLWDKIKKKHKILYQFLALPILFWYGNRKAAEMTSAQQEGKEGGVCE
jgi:hypothetical protein